MWAQYCCPMMSHVLYQLCCPYLLLLQRRLALFSIPRSIVSAIDTFQLPTHTPSSERCRRNGLLVEIGAAGDCILILESINGLHALKTKFSVLLGLIAAFQQVRSAEPLLSA